MKAASDELLEKLQENVTGGYNIRNDYADLVTALKALTDQQTIPIIKQLLQKVLDNLENGTTPSFTAEEQELLPEELRTEINRAWNMAAQAKEAELEKQFGTLRIEPDEDDYSAEGVTFFDEIDE